MSKKTQAIKEKQKRERKLRNKIVEERSERELFLSNKKMNNLLNKMSGATFVRDKNTTQEVAQIEND